MSGGHTQLCLPLPSVLTVFHWRSFIDPNSGEDTHTTLRVELTNIKYGH